MRQWPRLRRSAGVPGLGCVFPVVHEGKPKQWDISWALGEVPRDEFDASAYKDLLVARQVRRMNLEETATHCRDCAYLLAYGDISSADIKEAIKMASPPDCVTRVFAVNVRQGCCPGPEGKGCPATWGRGCNGNHILVDSGGRVDQISVTNAMLDAWRSQRYGTKFRLCKDCAPGARTKATQFVIGWRNELGEEGKKYAITDAVIETGVRRAREALFPGGRKVKKGRQKRVLTMS